MIELARRDAYLKYVYEIYGIRGVYEDFAIRGWRYLFDARFITSKEKIKRKGRHSR